MGMTDEEQLDEDMDEILGNAGMQRSNESIEIALPKVPIDVLSGLQPNTESLIPFPPSYTQYLPQV